MIRDHGVRVIVGCYGSNHSIGVSKVCQRSGTVLWVQTAWTATLFDHKPRYTFRTNDYAALVEEAAGDFVLRYAFLRIGKTKKQMRAAVINEGGAWRERKI
jgi:ABC-type branched-subunit amino acid transport system substrate-binding protein